LRNACKQGTQSVWILEIRKVSGHGIDIKGRGEAFNVEIIWFPYYKQQL